MKLMLKALGWRLRGSYERNGPVEENSSIHAQNRAKYEIWKYNTFGPGKGVYGRDDAYRVVDSGQLAKAPLYMNDPWDLAALASVIAEMEGHAEIAFREPRVLPRDVQSALEIIARQETDAIERAGEYFCVNPEDLTMLIEKLKSKSDY